MDGELQQELETLKSSVCQIREKFLNKWTGETYKKLSNASKRQQADGVKCGQENIQELEDRIGTYRGELAKLGQDQSQQEKELSLLETELSMLSLKSEQLSKKKVLRVKQLDDAKKYNMEQEQGVKKAREKTVLRMNQFTKGIKFFQENLGFTFKKVDDDHLQFVFKYIDPKDREAPFTFTVKIDDSGIYHIKDCSPMIENLSVLTDELNKTNDFSKFVISVRQGFKELRVNA